MTFCSRGELGIVQENLSTEANDIRKQTEEWGAHVEEKLKEFVMVEEFQRIFVGLSENVKALETNLRDKHPKSKA